MAVRLVFLGKLADLAGAAEIDIDAPLDWMMLSEALEGELGDLVESDKVKIAVNGVVLAHKAALSAGDGDEVALLPPVSGGYVRDVRVASEALAPEAELSAFSAAHPAAGGIASFVGKVRPEDGVEALELTHYPPLTLPGMTALADTALARWSLDGILLLHRTGLMGPGEAIVLVAAAARHRRDAIATADFAMDHLKSEAWFWKRERRAGVWRWIEPRAQDHADLARWS